MCRTKQRTKDHLTVYNRLSEQNTRWRPYIVELFHSLLFRRKPRFDVRAQMSAISGHVFIQFFFCFVLLFHFYFYFIFNDPFWPIDKPL